MSKLNRTFIVGNVSVKGFVNYISRDNGNVRLLIGTGSFTDRNGEKVFKETVTSFIDSAFDGQLPENGDYVQVSGDLNISKSTRDAGELNFAMNTRFANQIVKLERPGNNNSNGNGAPAPANQPEDDI